MKKLNKYLAIARITLTNDLVYFWDYLSKNVFFIFIMFVYYMLWKTLFAAKGEVIQGFTLNGMMWYLVVTELITLSRPNVHVQVANEVKDGSIAYLLSKPYDYVLYNFSVFSGGAAVKMITNGLTGLLIGLVFVGPLSGLQVTHLPFIVVSILLGSILNFLIYMSLALSAFWLEENSAFFWIYSKLVFTLGGMLMPIDLFPMWLQKIATAMPFAYVTYAPARLAVKFEWTAFYELVTLQLVYVLVFYLVAHTLNRRGAKILNVQGG